MRVRSLKTRNEVWVEIQSATLNVVAAVLWMFRRNKQVTVSKFASYRQENMSLFMSEQLYVRE